MAIGSRVQKDLPRNMDKMANEGLLGDTARKVRDKINAIEAEYNNAQQRIKKHAESPPRSQR